MDRDGYPEDHELDTIREWDPRDPGGLLDYVQERWRYPDFWVEEGGLVHVSTGGWSGNEDLIEAMRDNIAWNWSWLAERRGGHYVFYRPSVKPRFERWGWRVDREEVRDGG